MRKLLCILRLRGHFPARHGNLLFLICFTERHTRKGYLSCAAGGISPLDRLRSAELKANSD